jgi:hypothetical protein
MMVEVFRTNINKVGQSKILIKKVLQHFPKSMVNVDLEDCDKVLRIEGENIYPEKIIELVNLNGFECVVLL